MNYKKFLCLSCLVVFAFTTLVACGECSKKSIELMGAGDRIHDTYTFANVGTKIKENAENEFLIYGSVDKLDNEKVREEFKIDQDVKHIVAIKLCAIDTNVEKNEVEIKVDGVRNYDAEHLNGSDYTFILLEASAGKIVSISAKWSKSGDLKNYIVKFDSNLELK